MTESRMLARVAKERDAWRAIAEGRKMGLSVKLTDKGKVRPGDDHGREIVEKANAMIDWGKRQLEELEEKPPGKAPLSVSWGDYVGADL